MEILVYPNPFLRKKLPPVAAGAEEVHHVADEMFKVMRAAQGIGLAANQVGYGGRMFVLCMQDGIQEVFLNPVMVKRKGKESAEEGCLSFPGMSLQITRPKQIILRYRNLLGREEEMEATGLKARLIAHELDHLDGVLFIDRARPAARISIQHKLREMEKRYAGKP